MEGNLSLIFLVIWPIFGAILSYVIGRKNKKLRDDTVELIVLIEFVSIIILCFTVVSGEELKFSWKDFCARGIYFKMDGFRAVQMFLTGFLWLMTTLFTKQYFAVSHNRNRYYFFWLLTLAATLGIFMSSDLFTTFIFFEIMSFTSFVWILHEEDIASKQAAQTYLAVAVAGGMVMLMGLFLLYHEVGTLHMDELLTACKAVEDKTMLSIASGCLLVGFGAKAGMYPLHFWLPNSYQNAPVPATAVLSGILSKTGIFGILVISSQILRYDENFGRVMVTFGVITMIAGAILALFSNHLMRILACSSISQIGFILVGIGMQGLLKEDNTIAVRGTILHMVNHSLFKLVLFMAAGVVFMNLHELDLNAIRGFGRKKKALLFSFLMGALGIGGIPLWSGYLSKTLLHESIVEYQELIKGTSMADTYVFVEWMFLIAGGLTVAYMLKIFVALFVEKNPNQKPMSRGKQQYMSGKTAVALVGSSIVIPILGFLPNITMDQIADLSQDFVHAETLKDPVSYFRIGNLFGSFISVSIGLIIYFGFVRTVLMKRVNGRKEYVSVWPAWMNLEDLVYRPILIYFIPFVLAVLCRIFDKLMDAIIYIISKYILGPKKNRKSIHVGTRFSFVFGTIMDDLVKVLNKTIRKRRPIELSFIELFAISTTEVNRTSRLVTRSVSFGLLLFCIGLLITLLYLLAVSSR